MAMARRSACRAARTARSTVATWPVCTPSKYPRVTAEGGGIDLREGPRDAARAVALGHVVTSAVSSSGRSSTTRARPSGP